MFKFIEPFKQLLHVQVRSVEKNRNYNRKEFISTFVLTKVQKNRK
jgi:hypothetical protein